MVSLTIPAMQRIDTALCILDRIAPITAEFLFERFKSQRAGHRFTVIHRGKQAPEKHWFIVPNEEPRKAWLMTYAESNRYETMTQAHRRNLLPEHYVWCVCGRRRSSCDCSAEVIALADGMKKGGRN